MEVILEKKTTLATLASEVKIYPQLLQNLKVSDMAKPLKGTFHCIDDVKHMLFAKLIRQGLHHNTKQRLRSALAHQNPSIASKLLR